MAPPAPPQPQREKRQRDKTSSQRGAAPFRGTRLSPPETVKAFQQPRAESIYAEGNRGKRPGPGQLHFGGILLRCHTVSTSWLENVNPVPFREAKKSLWISFTWNPSPLQSSSLRRDPVSGPTPRGGFTPVPRHDRCHDSKD